MTTLGGEPLVALSGELCSAVLFNFRADLGLPESSRDPSSNIPYVRFFGVAALLVEFRANAVVRGVVLLGAGLRVRVRVGEGVGELLGSNMPMGRFVGVTIWFARRFSALLQPRFGTSSVSDGSWLSSSAWLDSEEAGADIFTGKGFGRAVDSEDFEPAGSFNGC